MALIHIRQKKELYDCHLLYIYIWVCIKIGRPLKDLWENQNDIKSIGWEPLVREAPPTSWWAVTADRRLLR